MTELEALQRVACAAGEALSLLGGKRFGKWDLGMGRREGANVLRIEHVTAALRETLATWQAVAKEE